MSREEDGFLSRWSRRKQEARRAPEPDPTPEPEAPPGPAAEPTSPAEAQVPAVDPDAITPEELAALPPVESIGPETDIAGFLRKGVPAALRKAALRRVWAADPAIRDYVNEAREYAYDWNVPGGVPGSGELDPGEARTLLARMFGEPSPEARPGVTEPAGDPAPQPPPNPDPVAEAAPENAPAPQADTPPGEPAPQAAASEAEPRDVPKPVQNEPGLRAPRRHGGATPV